MKLLFIIDHLGLGGAQRQIVELACGLVRRKHDVEIFNYFPRYDFFRAYIEEHGIAVHDFDKRKGFSVGVLRNLAFLMRRGGYDFAISFLNSPNIYAELANASGGGARLIVSERCSHHDDQSILVAHGRRLMHFFADHVVTNSQSHAQWLRQKWWLKEKVSCIYNGVAVAARYEPPAAVKNAGHLQLLGVGRICAQKNLCRLIAALQLYLERFGDAPQISWAGKRDSSPEGLRYAAEVDRLLENAPQIRARWHWLGEQPDIGPLLRTHHALIHPSLYEGLPNAVCEALAAGMPVLISDVCDHSLLVAEGLRGFLFDPYAPASIAEAMSKLHDLESSTWRQFSRNAKLYAEENLGVDGMITGYEELFVKLLAKSDSAAAAKRELSR